MKHLGGHRGKGELRPETLLVVFEKCLAGEPGFEPGLTESESVGLPLTYSPAGAVMNRAGRAGKPL